LNPRKNWQDAEKLNFSVEQASACPSACIAQGAMQRGGNITHLHGAAFGRNQKHPAASFLNLR
jgi:hypothetical protein